MPSMKGMIRVVLVDPLAESRLSLRELLGGINGIWVAECCSSYEEGERATAEHMPDLTLVVLDADPEKGISLIQKVSRARPDAVVLPASKPKGSDTILKAIRAGAREYLLLPVELDDLLGAIDRLIGTGDDTASASRRAGKVVAVTGAIGGVGCTSLAVNLGVALAEQADHSVVLADFDMLFGCVDTCLDMIPDRTLLDVAQHVDRLDLPLLKRSLTRHASGLFVLPHPIAMEDVGKIEPDSLRRVVSLLKAGFQTIVVDTSKSLQAFDFVAFELADTILVVVQLELICLRNTARLLHLFRQFDGVAEKVRVVVNRVGSLTAEIGVKKAAETLDMPISWEIPNAFKNFSGARARGVPLAVEAPNGRPHRAIQEIARALSPEPPKAENAKERKSRFGSLFQRKQSAAAPAT